MDFRGGSIKNFREMWAFLKELKPSSLIYIQGAFTDFRLATILAGFILAKGNVFMHENLGAEAPLEKQSRRYLGFIPGWGLWWYSEMLRNNFRAHFSKSILVVSKEIKERMVSLWAYPEHKIKVGYHGIDLSRFSPADEKSAQLRESLGIPKSDTVIIATARFAKEKCLHRLIEAFGVLSKENHHLHLLMAGTGPLDPELRSLALSMPGTERIRFLGHVTNVIDYLRSSDIYVLSSDNEGLSLAFLEAMATGLICVSTNCTGSSEVLQNGVNGFLVQKSTDGVLHGLRTALALSPQEKQRISHAARQFVLEKFDINQRVQEVLESFGLPCVPPNGKTAALKGSL
jgi:glycosyltransferase involved in cell wall biosynthesis